jgi:hypothetical protein
MSVSMHHHRRYIGTQTQLVPNPVTHAMIQSPPMHWYVLSILSCDTMMALHSVEHKGPAASLYRYPPDRVYHSLVTGFVAPKVVFVCRCTIT